MYYNNTSSFPLDDKGYFEYNDFFKDNYADNHQQYINLFNTMLLEAEQAYHLFDTQQKEQERDMVIKQIKQKYLYDSIHRISQELGKEKDPEKIKVLTQQSHTLITQYKAL